MKKKTFELTIDHLTLLKRMHVDNYNSYSSTPYIDSKRPYGNSNIEADIIETLGWKIESKEELEEGEIPEKLLKRADKIHKEMTTVLQIVLCNLTFLIGTYEKTDPHNSLSWRFKK